MSRIVIEVDESVAKAFMRADAQRQRSISNAINGWMKKALNATSMGSYRKFLDGMSDEAAANGLTPEKLEQLLNEGH